MSSTKSNRLDLRIRLLTATTVAAYVLLDSLLIVPFDPNAASMKVSYLHHDGVNSTWAEEVI
jgi:hypothetical protein